MTPCNCPHATSAGCLKDRCPIYRPTAEDVARYVERSPPLVNDECTCRGCGASPPLVPARDMTLSERAEMESQTRALHAEIDEELAKRPRRFSPPLADDDVNPKTLVGARKIDLSLLPPAATIHGAHAMMDGAGKYGPYNWREKKVPARTYIAAAGRHLADFLDGEETAPDSGVHHLGHVIGCCAILLDAMETGNLIDDRPVKGAAAAILARLEAAIRDRASEA